METLEDFRSTRWSHVRSMVTNMVPGFVLPAALFFSLRPHVGVMLALIVASCVPGLDAIIRIVRGRSLNWFALLFLPSTALSVSLATLLHSPVFLLAKGGVMSALMGLAFGVSAVIGRPLTRTMALQLSSDQREGRLRLAERWGHPRALAVFRILAVGWGLLLLLLGGQQILLAISTSPGVVMALEPPVHLAVTALGIVSSVLYVRRIQLAHPELGLLPVRSSQS
ncbi:MAG: hypothetical protein E6G44_10705 [Actinobacteria bacterium]|nr:MAG: hypothetical protein E6G44_10705 [Actinomycetota bacterium]